MSLSEFQYGKVLPQAVPSEEVLLGELVSNVNQHNTRKILDSMEGIMYYKPAHQTIFDTISVLDKEGKKWDMVIVAEKLKTLGLMEEIGGITYLVELTTHATGTVDEHINIVIKNYQARQLILFCTDTVTKAFEMGTNPFELITLLGNQTQRLLIANTISSGISESAKEVARQIEFAKNNPGKTINPLFGVRSMDQLSGGWDPGDLIIIGARPGMGKSIVAVQIGVFLSFNQEIPVLIVSLEMSGNQYILRMVANITKMDSLQLRHGDISDDQYMEALEGTYRIENNKHLFIEDKTGQTVEDVRRIIYSYVSRHKIKVVVIDHGGKIVYTRPNGNPVNEIGHITGTLKDVAKALDIAVVLFWQLNREVENDSSRMPKLKHLRASGNLEEDATKVAFLMRPDYYDFENMNINGINYNDLKRLLIYIQAKHRDGLVGIDVAKIMIESSLITDFSSFDY